MHSLIVSLFVLFAVACRSVERRDGPPSSARALPSDVALAYDDCAQLPVRPEIRDEGSSDAVVDVSMLDLGDAWAVSLMAPAQEVGSEVLYSGPPAQPCAPFELHYYGRADNDLNAASGIFALALFLSCPSHGSFGSFSSD